MNEKVDSSWLKRFEPLGRNCEFGFVLRHLGYNRPALFRWAYVAPVDLCRLLAERFEGAFQYENISPGTLNNKGMVLDKKYNWQFHSAIRSNDEGHFVLPDEDVKKLHRIEHAKVLKDVEMFDGRLSRGSVVCIHVSKSITDEEGATILAAIDEYSGNTKNALLMVGETVGTKIKPGAVAQIAPRMVRGYVSKISPPGFAHDADFESWGRILHYYRFPPKAKPGVGVPVPASVKPQKAGRFLGFLGRLTGRLGRPK